LHSEREADHSPPSSAEVKEWVELYLHSPIRLYGVVLGGAQGQLYFLLFTNESKSCDSSVSIVTRLRDGRSRL
jgi:hypothetical protein